ncbi:uncharacterized protein [Physcomitrium patens]|uniref:Uncharacterized protein n=1 Tax=Physcomitrium patens TaxID=3218 RepID=A0A2K1LB55_PHYPA|nr:uncharacterized protein LOC112290998 isoform X1 [Physcomitrium patens]PNR63247.1 hypothetical protein PHYPA_001672 [Physcomitrium patens]|eukprot:XP_024393683.1 uncharacterized protein LOC112290998 isoform X1 [Physcomitrella patens]
MRMGATVEECELPSFYELLDRFSLFDSSASSGCDVQIGKNGSLFCKCEGCIRWSDFVEGRDPSDIEVKYEVFTREHVAGLACYLRTRAAEFELSVMDVLEVGAGSGRLSYHLNKYLSQLFTKNQGPVVRVVATDSGVRGLDGPSVKKEDAIDAISTRKTQIIISSWMPRSVDWTAHMRVQQSVLEYILIGETDNGICGCPWKTWGFSSPWDWSDSDDSDFDASVSIALQSQEDGSCLRESKESTNGHDRTRGSISSNSGSQIGRTRREKPLYEIDGWERLELHSLSRLQLCRTDERWSSSRHSHTVSFRRKQDAAACCGHTLSPGGWKIENSFSVEE